MITFKVWYTKDGNYFIEDIEAESLVMLILSLSIRMLNSIDRIVKMP